MMNYINEMHLKFLSKSVNESFARNVVASFVLELDPTINEIADIKTAVSEAVTNSIVHGYRRASGMIYIDAKITDSKKVIIKVKDKGMGI
jgi:stage II sporulation protein AB (anti-sigma F factor)